MDVPCAGDTASQTASPATHRPTGREDGAVGSDALSLDEPHRVTRKWP